MVKTPCDTLNNGNGSPIRQNPYKNNIQTPNVNGIIHFVGTKKMNRIYSAITSTSFTLRRR